MFDRALRTLAHVPRWAILRVNRRQSVAEHSYYVAVYALEIARAIGWKGDLGRLAMVALTHDVDEVVTGDVPSPVKKHGREADPEWLRAMLRNRLSPSSLYWTYDDRDEDERCIAKLADMIESILYLCDERSQGNQNTVHMEGYMWEQLKGFWTTVFVPQFKLDLSRLSTGGLLWASIVDAAGTAARSADPVVA